jgi:thiol-disulfide isomerase/thioredoxin
MASRKSKKTGLLRSKRTRLITLIVIIAIVVVVGIVLSRSSCSPSDGTLSIITWDETTLSTLKKTPVVLNFWASWCGPCSGELPYFEAVAQESEGEIKVVVINVGESASTIQSFFGDYEPTMIVASDRNGEAFADYCQNYGNPQGYIPFTLFVDSEGIVKHAKIGAFMSEEELWGTLHDLFGTAIP